LNAPESNPRRKDRPFLEIGMYDRGSTGVAFLRRDKTGRSDGYVAAGGPGYAGFIDTVGNAAIQTAAGR
jgi:hypothetical protein